MGMACFTIRMGTFTKVNSSKTKHVAKVFTRMRVQNSGTRANGSTTSSTVKASKSKKIIQFTKASFCMGLKMVGATSCGMTARRTREKCAKIWFGVRGSLSGRMDESTKATGSRTKCRGEASTGGQTDATILVSTTIIRSMAEAGTHGPTRKATKAIGRGECSTAAASCALQMARRQRANGSTGRISAGYKK
jgi:hypothetical protein